MSDLLSAYGLTIYDVLAVLALLIFLILGLIKGFVKEVSGLIASIVGFVGAKVIASKFSSIVMLKLNAETIVREKLTEIVSNLDTSSVDNFQMGLRSEIEGIKGFGNVIRNIPIENFDIIAETNFTEKLETLCKMAEEIGYRIEEGIKQDHYMLYHALKSK